MDVRFCLVAQPELFQVQPVTGVLDGLGDGVDSLIVTGLERAVLIIDVDFGKGQLGSVDPSHVVAQGVDECVSDERAIRVGTDEGPVRLRRHSQDDVIRILVVVVPQLDAVGRL